MLSLTNFDNCAPSQVENHGVDEELMEKVKALVNKHYEETMKETFYGSDVARTFGGAVAEASNIDWESSFFYRHQPDSNLSDLPELLR